MTYTVLVTVPELATQGHQRLIEAGANVLCVGTQSPRDDLARLLRSHPVDGIIARTHPLTAKMIDSCPTLRAISRHGVGHDAVDIEAAAARGIPVSIAAGANAQSVAELTIGLMLAAARMIPAQNEAIRGGGWPKAKSGIQLGGRRLGVVGYGRIAQRVADMARAIGMEIAVFDPALGSAPVGVSVTPDLAGLLSVSDVLSLHCPLTPATRNMIGARELEQLPPGAIIVNTARGGLIDETALAAALRAGHVAGAGLDTLAQEPPEPDNPLLSVPQVVLTPHVAGSTDRSLAQTAVMAVENLLAMLEGRPLDPQLIVNRHLLKNQQSA